MGKSSIFNRVRLSKSLLWAAGIIGLGGIAASNTHAAIAVPAGGVTENFTTLPNKNEWWTTSLAGGSGDITDDTTFNTKVAGMSSLSVLAGVAGNNGQRTLLADPDNPPLAASNNAIAKHNTPGQFLQSFPTGNAATVIGIQLSNASGAAADGVDIAFTLGQLVNTNADAIPGFRAYYSPTADVGTWTAVGNFGVVGANNISITTPWADGAPLHVILVDDNGAGAPDPAWTIDAVTLTPKPGVPEPTTLSLLGVAMLATLRRNRK